MGSINELVWMGVWCVEIELRRMTMNDIGFLQMIFIQMFKKEKIIPFREKK